MAAATVALARANKNALYERFKRVCRDLWGRAKTDGMSFVIDSGAIVPTSIQTDDADDILEVIQFPEGAKLEDLQIVSTAEVDSGGAAWVYDVTAFDGTTHSVLISGCTVGRGASDEDEMDLNTGFRWLDVGGDYLCIKTTTPPTANAGTGSLRVKVKVFQGPLINISA